MVPLEESGLRSDVVNNIWNKFNTERFWPENYGDVRPPYSVQRDDGTRFVVVGTTVYRSESDETWLGFLYDHLQTVLGDSWFAEEAYKDSPDNMHTIVRWFKEVCAREMDGLNGFTQNLDNPNAACLAFRSLAYDLFCLFQMNAADLPTVERLKKPDQFEGARYEVWAAASFIRAGFTIEYEDEADRSSTHCEFVAKSKTTNKVFSVECKRRHRPVSELPTTYRLKRKVSLGIDKLLSKALRKDAAHERIIFIDVNMPPHEGDFLKVPWLAEFKATKRRLQRQKGFRESASTQAIIIASNHPYFYFVDEEPDPRNHIFGTAFNKPDLDNGDPIYLLSTKYPEVLALMQSISQHFMIPTDFP